MTDHADIPIPAVSVVNGTKDSVVFIKIDPKYAEVSSDEMRTVSERIKTQLVGSCMEGAKVIVTCGIDIEIAMPEESAKLHNEGLNT
jgi:hypothetical protein